MFAYLKKLHPSKWHTLPRKKRFLLLVGLPPIITCITYLVLLLTINWQERLCQAAIDGNISKAKTALFFNASPKEACVYAGQTWSAITHAIHNKHPEMLRFLVSCGASIDYKLYDAQQNWYHIVIAVVDTDDEQILETYIKLGGKTDSCTYQHLNALTYAITKGKMSAVKVLSNHLDINTPDGTGLLPLTHAYQLSDTTVRRSTLDALMFLGADIHHQTDEGETALHQYVSLSDIIGSYEAIADITSWLKKHKKFSLDVPNKRGLTPLMIAGKKGNWRAMDALVDAGSNVVFTNKKGVSVFDILVENNEDYLFRVHAAKLKQKKPRAFKKLQKKFPRRITKTGVIKRIPRKRLASGSKRYRPRVKRYRPRRGLGRALLRRLGPVGFILSFL